MDISGRIRAVLAAQPLETRLRDVFSLMAMRVVRERTNELAAGAISVEGFLRGRWAPNQLAMSFAMRLVPGLVGDVRGYAMRLAESDSRESERLLWSHWLLMLGEHLGGPGSDAALMEGLWKRAFASQAEGEDASVQAVTHETLMDAFVYDELVGLHAAYQSARLTGDPAMMERVRRAVRWHVRNTQPDHTTQEPWALAAFAALDETGTFAEQQLHDAAMGLRSMREWPGERAPAAVGLLADAVITMDNLTL